MIKKITQVHIVFEYDKEYYGVTNAIGVYLNLEQAELVEAEKKRK